VWREVSISGSRDERIAAVARLQRGRIAFRQLRAIGVAPASIDWLVAKGRLLRSLRCVFCSTSPPRPRIASWRSPSIADSWNERCGSLNSPFGRWTLDFYWPDGRFVVEVDGPGFHSTRYRFERDRRKDDELRGAHIEVMRIGGRDITERSHAVIADITRALTRRGL